MSKISLELEDLKRAVQQCQLLRQKLQTQEQQIKSIYNRLHDWKGVSAEKLSQQMESFLQKAAVHIQELEAQKEQLLRYIHRMEELDRQSIR